MQLQSAMAQDTIHPLWLRLTHWLNALAAGILAMSGWRIYDASPLFAFRFPSGITLGGITFSDAAYTITGDTLTFSSAGVITTKSDSGAVSAPWHFAAMWLLAGNGLIYLLLNAGSGRLPRKFFPLSASALYADLRAALHGRLAHADPHSYNSVQRTAYLFVMLDTTLLVLSGLVLWKSVQFPLLRELLGDYETARRMHFFAMTGLLCFLAVHLAMVALLPRTLAAMIRGR